MEVRSLRLAKKTGTYADSLAVAGLERLLYLLDGGRSRIEDRGGFYELILDAPVRLEELDYESVRNSPGYRYIKLKESSSVPLHHFDYQAEGEVARNYWELRSSLGDNPTQEQRNQLEEMAPQPQWSLYRNVYSLKGFGAPNRQGAYNKLHEYIRNAEPSDFREALFLRLGNLADGDLAEIAASKTFKPDVSSVQAFAPLTGKGINAPKTTLPDASSLPNKFLDWFGEYLKYLGLSLVANARAIGRDRNKDVKLFVLAPGSIDAGMLGKLSSDFFRLRLRSASTQIDIQSSLGVAMALVSQLSSDDLDEYGEKTPRDFISGIQTAYFKNLGKAHALTNVGFIGLPGWFPVTSENSGEWLEMLSEHGGVLRVLDEERSEEAELLFLYRDFLSADMGQTLNTQALFEFLSSYASFFMRARERKRYVRPFTTNNLRRLLVSLNSKFREIVEDPGFRAVAGAIRRSTVTEQYHKSKGNQVFEIEYGLFQDFKRKARFPDQFVGALSEFINSYNAQNARREEQLKGKGGRRRARLTVGDLDSVVKLIDEHEPESVAMLLIAYGSARDPRAPDEAAEIAATEEKQEA